ncbi:MAG TPA: alpha/beta hydrolase [Acidimicrobiales bacterium]
MTTTADAISATTTPNRSVDSAVGVRFAYRRFGEPSEGVMPLVLLQHLRGNLDNWDPLLVDSLASRREVILFDNAGVGLSGGTTPCTVTEMARDAISFLDALGLGGVDLLGYSIGGMVAQELTLLRPQQVRRLVVAATGPRGGGTYPPGGPFDIAAPVNAREEGAERYLSIFSLTESSRRRGMDYLSRLQDRTEDRDLPVGHQAQTAQYDALVDWCIPEPCKLARLTGIRQRTLVTSGDNDTIIPTENAHILGTHLPNARVRIFDDAGHGFVFQWPVEFAQLVQDFLIRA